MEYTLTILDLGEMPTNISMQLMRLTISLKRQVMLFVMFIRESLFLQRSCLNLVQ